MIVGLTGGIGSGKTSVADAFKELGAYVIDWDELARRVVEPGRVAWEGIVEHFGKDVLRKDGAIDRQKLGDIVFNDAVKRVVLNRIVHPEVFREDVRLTKEIKKRDPHAVIIKDIPLLIEESLTGRVDKVIVVYATQKNRLTRLAARGMPTEEALRRMAAQLPLDDKAKSADFVIYNDGSLEKTKKQVKEVYAELLRCRD
jgi:dephospho-CoA kinase